MKKTFTLILSLFITLQSYALSSYIGEYKLYAKTKLGSLHIGTAQFVLDVDDNKYIYTTEANTSSLLKALYDYSRSEQSIGEEIDGELISTHFAVVERIKNEVKKNYNFTIIDRNSVIASTGKEWTIDPGNLVDQLSVYLALSMDIQKNPDQVEFIYQVADEDGVEYQKFLVEGYQTVTIQDNEMETIVIHCPELELTLNLSLEHNFQPVLIHKINGNSEFKLVLKEFTTPS
jgi:hypothetical protein